VLRLINGFLHGLQKLVLHVVVHVGHKVVHDVLGLLYLAQVVLELDVLHHV
jgi:hypothetical protein